MHNRLIVLLTLILFSASRQKMTQPQDSAHTASVDGDTTAVLSGSASKLTIQTHSFSEIDSSGILLFPLSIAEKKGRNEDAYYQSDPGTPYWNVIFYNSKTGNYQLLSERKMLIQNLNMQYNSDAATNLPQPRTALFYKIIVDDFNRDQELTAEDPEYLFVSDKEGNNFRQISPAAHSVKTWGFIRSANKVVMTLTKDSDNNRKFDEKDEVVTFEIGMEKDTVPSEVFPTDFKNKLKGLYNRDWKQAED